MKCTCDHARHEARAEAFRSAAALARGWYLHNSEAAAAVEPVAMALEYYADVATTSHGAGAGDAIPVPPVSGSPETGSPLSGPHSAYADIPEDESLSAAVAKLVEDDGFITEWPDSYPFKDLAWPGADGGRDGA